MSDESNGAASSDAPVNKPLDYIVAEIVRQEATGGLQTAYVELSRHATSAEAAKEVKRLLGAIEAEGREFFVLNRIYGPVKLRARVERVSVKVDGLEAKRKRAPKVKDETQAASAPQGEKPASTRRHRRAESSADVSAHV